MVRVLFDAISGCRPSLPESDRWRIAGVIQLESERFGYDPLFVQALVEVESSCLPTARSARGALGLIQLRPSTAKAVAEAAGVEWRGKQMLTRPVFNLHLGLRYLRQLEERFNDPYLAVAAYNLGPQRVAQMPRARARRSRYVRKVLNRYEDLLAEHAPALRHIDPVGASEEAAGHPLKLSEAASSEKEQAKRGPSSREPAA